MFTKHHKRILASVCLPRVVLELSRRCREEQCQKHLHSPLGWVLPGRCWKPVERHAGIWDWKEFQSTREHRQEPLTGDYLICVHINAAVISPGKPWNTSASPAAAFLWALLPVYVVVSPLAKKTFFFRFLHLKRKTNQRICGLLWNTAGHSRLGRCKVQVWARPRCVDPTWTRLPSGRGGAWN